MEIKADFYRWGMQELPIPDWVMTAQQDGTIIHDGDGDAFLASTSGRMRIDPGAYLMRSMDTIFLVDAAVYDAMVAGAVKGVTPPKDLDADDGLGDPPFSSSVLARSARARAKQAKWESTQPVPNANNAHVEGANVPDATD
jgi:hypothetical protein